MPPKKAGGKGKGKDGGPAKMADKENLSRAESEILSLQHLLELRSHEVRLELERAHRTLAVQALEARRSERLWRERMDALNSASERQKEDTLDITADMIRQYKSMQEQMLRKVAALEIDTATLRRGQQDRDSQIKALEAERDAVRRSCDAEVNEYQRKMEDMQVEFATRLRETLDKMHVRLQNSQAFSTG